MAFDGAIFAVGKVEVQHIGGNMASPPADSSPQATYQIFTSMRWDPARSVDAHIFQEMETGQMGFQGGVNVHPNDLLRYHLDRLIASARALRFVGAYKRLVGDGSEYDGLNHLLGAIDAYLRSPLCRTRSICKLNIFLDQAGELEIDSSPLIDTPESPWLFIPTRLDPGVVYGGPNSTKDKKTDILEDGIVTNHRVGTGFRVSEFFDFQKHHSDAALCTVFLDPSRAPPTLFTTHKTTARGLYESARQRANIRHTAPKVAEVLLQNEEGEIMEASVSTAYFHRNIWVTPPLSSGGNAGVTRRVALEHQVCVEEVVLASSLRDGEVIWLSNAVRGFWRATVRLPEKVYVEHVDTKMTG